MSTHPNRIWLLVLLALSVFSAFVWLDKTELSANAPLQARQTPTPRLARATLSSSPQITITNTGFDPVILTVTQGTSVTWYNATSTAHILQSGVPTNTLFLPLITKNQGSSNAPVITTVPRTPANRGVQRSGGVISGTVQAFGYYTITFHTLGDYPYFLSDVPQFKGQVVVQSVSSTLCGNISQNTFLPTSSNVYQVTCNVTIDPNVTLTLEPGVIIKFNSGTSLQVSQGATLNAIGTSGSPIYFTSIKDDSVGGDTNNDGNITVPGPNDWGRIDVQATGNPALADGTLNFDYVTVRYGGNGGPMLNVSGAATINHSTLALSWTYGLAAYTPGNPGSSLTISNSVIANNGNYGLVIDGRAGAVTSSTFSNNSIHLNNSTGASLTNNTITFVGSPYSAGIQVTNSTPTLSNNTVSGWTFPVLIDAGYPQSVPSYSGNTFTGNRYLAIGVTGNLASGTWQNFGGYLHAINGTATLPSLATLTVPAGMVIKFDTNSSLAVSARATLNAIGTSGSPIYFTSIKDDSVGGDTNNDGNITVPGPNDWGRIDVQATGNPALADGTLNFDYVTVRYGGNGGPMLNVSGAATINHSTLALSWTYGLAAYTPGNPGSTISIANGNSFYSNANYGLYNARTTPIDARNDWWGSDSGPTHLSNPLGTGDRVSDNVLFDPWIGKTGFVQHNSSPSTSWTSFVAEPVNVVFGTYTYQHIDLSVPSVGTTFAFHRSYNSANASMNSSLGYGWTQSYNWSAVVQTVGLSNTVLITLDDGRVDRYFDNGNGTFTAPKGVYDILTFNAGAYTLTRKDQTKYNFNGAGKLASIVDKNNNTVSLTYSGNNIASITDTAGRTYSFTSDGSGRITVITDPIGRTISFSYDASGNLTSFTDARGKITTYAYDTNHRMTSITDANGHTFVQNTYDANGKVTQQRDAKLNLTTFSYDTANLRTIVTDARSNATTYTYDSLSRIVSEKDALNQTLSYGYDSNNNRIQVTDKRGYNTFYAYDANGNPTTITDALSHASQFTYDIHNNLLTKTDPLSHVTTNTYDTHDNLSTTTNISGTTTFGYNVRGLLTSVTDANSHTTQYAYNTNGDRTSTTDPLSNVTSATYDNGGRRLTQTDPLAHTTQFAYNANNNLTTITDPSSHATTYAYDNVGNKISITDANGKTTSFSYDEKDQLVTVTDALNNHVTYAYDAVGNKTQMTDANSHVTNYTYDALNRLVTVADPLSNTTRYGYDANGNKTSILDAKSQTTTFSYDALNRLTNIQYPTSSVQYAYDAVGNRLTIVDPTGTTSNTYDGLDRVIRVQAPNGTVQYAYDAVGNRTKIVYPNSNAAIYTYDNANRLKNVTDWASHVFTYTYDIASNRVSLDDPNGAHTAYTYDTLNRSTAITTTTPFSGTIFFARYSLDNVGNRTQMVDSEGTTNYTYDAFYRLTNVSYPGATSTQYAYDAMGNRTMMTNTVSGVINYSYDSADRLLTAGATAFTWDNNGNQLTKGAATYQYDVANRLTLVVNGGTTDQFTYDGDGKRAGKTVNGTATSYTYDVNAAMPIVLTETTSGATITYLYGADLLAQYDNAGTPTYYHADGLGSVRAMSNPAGQRVATYNYDTFGTVRNSSGVASTFKFAGEQSDDEAGLIFLRARYYDGGIGRFTSPDRWSGNDLLPQTLNRYVYSVNNPVTLTDPSGNTLQELRNGMVLGVHSISGVLDGYSTLLVRLSSLTGYLSTGAQLRALLSTDSNRAAAERLANRIDWVHKALEYIDAAVSYQSFSAQVDKYQYGGEPILANNVKAARAIEILSSFVPWYGCFGCNGLSDNRPFSTIADTIATRQYNIVQGFQEAGSGSGVSDATMQKLRVY